MSNSADKSSINTNSYSKSSYGYITVIIACKSDEEKYLIPRCLLEANTSCFEARLEHPAASNGISFPTITAGLRDAFSHFFDWLHGMPPKNELYFYELLDLYDLACGIRCIGLKNYVMDELQILCFDHEIEPRFLTKAVGRLGHLNRFVRFLTSQLAYYTSQECERLSGKLLLAEVVNIPVVGDWLKLEFDFYEKFDNGMNPAQVMDGRWHESPLDRPLRGGFGL